MFAAAVAIGLAPALVLTTGANAAAIVPVDPSLPVGPLNQLPSTVTGSAAKLTGSPMANQVLFETYRITRDPAFWSAVRAAESGTATTAQQAAIAAAPKPAVPATAVGPLTKLVGGSMQVFGAYQFGAMAGNKVAELTGIDKTGNVCRLSRSVGGVPGAAVALAAGAVCDPSGPGESYVSNSDGVGGFSGGSSCNPRGECAALFKEVTLKLSETVNRYYQCFRISGSNNARSQIGYGYVDMKNRESGGLLDLVQQWSESSGCLDGNGKVMARSWQDNTPNDKMQSWWLTREDGTPPEVATPGVLSADPLRQFLTKITGSDGLTYTSTSRGHHESDTDWAKPEMPLLPDGVGVDRMTITETGGPVPYEVYNEPATPEYQYQRDLAPECASGTCMLDLQKNGVSCFTAPGPCESWFEDPSKSTTYQCRYGSHSVALSECTVYAPTFKPPARTGAAPIGNPTTGEPMPNPNPVPGAPATIPLPGGGSANCFANGFASAPNPLEWVMVPVKCALQWAFVPDPKKIDAEVQKVQQAWSKTAPATVTAAVAGWNLAPASSGCGGIPFDFPLMQVHWSGVILDSCQAPLDVAADWAKVITSVSFSIGGALAITRMVAGVIGYQGLGSSSGSSS